MMKKEVSAYLIGWDGVLFKWAFMDQRSRWEGSVNAAKVSSCWIWIEVIVVFVINLNSTMDIIVTSWRLLHDSSMSFGFLKLNLVSKKSEYFWFQP